MENRSEQTSIEARSPATMTRAMTGYQESLKTVQGERKTTISMTSDSSDCNDEKQLGNSWLMAD